MHSARFLSRSAYCSTFILKYFSSFLAVQCKAVPPFCSSRWRKKYKLAIEFVMKPGLRKHGSLTLTCAIILARNLINELFFSSLSYFCTRIGNRNHLHMQKRDSKSFDSGALYRPEIDDDSNGTSSIERMERIERIERMERPERSEQKIMLPTPPVRPSTLTNQSENGSNANDRNKTDANNAGDGLSDSNKDENEQASSELNEVR